MKTIVINLKKREDRLASFKTCHPDLNFEVFNAVDGGQIHYGGLLSQGFDVCHDWIDPLLNTRLTKGEVGCFLSHWSIWQKCIERNEKVLILEDDARLTDRFDLQEIEEDNRYL